MRIDLTLKYLCLVKSRSIAKALSDNGLLLLNEAPARAAAAVRLNDRITIKFKQRALTIELLDIPQKQLSKSAAGDYYRVIGETSDDPLA